MKQYYNINTTVYCWVIVRTFQFILCILLYRYGVWHSKRRVVYLFGVVIARRNVFQTIYSAHACNTEATVRTLTKCTAISASGKLFQYPIAIGNVIQWRNIWIQSVVPSSVDRRITEMRYATITLMWYYAGTREIRTDNRSVNIIDTETVGGVGNVFSLCSGRGGSWTK